MGGLQDFSVSPSPLGFNWGGNLVGIGPGEFRGIKGLALGLDNFRHSSFSSYVPSFSSSAVFALKCQIEITDN